MIIAVDGPTASGKGTIAKALAAHFGLPHLDTGLLYRAVGRQCALNGGDPDCEADALAACAFPDACSPIPNCAAKKPAASPAASRSTPPSAARCSTASAPLPLQPGGAVLDGRDIGTVIAPEAEVKLFVVASVPARAERRFREMQQSGRAVTLADIAADLEARDTPRCHPQRRAAGAGGRCRCARHLAALAR